MKKIKLFLLAVFISVTVNAQKVALHTSTGVQHFIGTTGFTNAYNASSAGDTIYLPGGTFTPPTSIDKKLVILGAGHYNDSTLATGKTFINGNIILKENADEFDIEGVEITGKISFSYDESVNNVVIKRCKVNAGTEVLGGFTNPSQNLSLIGNVLIGAVYLGNAQIVLVSNNILYSGIDATNGNIISNNIFLNMLGNGSYENFRGDNNTLSNNIIVSCGVYGVTTGSYVGNIFKNNLFTCTVPGFGTTPTLISNYIGVAQTGIFINQTGIAFDYTHNYHLQNPTTYLGSDGTQIGIYGGIFPYKDGAVPCNPHFQIKSIAPQTNTSGELNIQIQVEAQDN